MRLYVDRDRRDLLANRDAVVRGWAASVAAAEGSSVSRPSAVYAEATPKSNAVGLKPTLWEFTSASLSDDAFDWAASQVGLLHTVEIS